MPPHKETSLSPVYALTLASHLESSHAQVTENVKWIQASRECSLQEAYELLNAMEEQQLGLATLFAFLYGALEYQQGAALNRLSNWRH
ncbi:hypothetical protein CPC08DRAFT_771380 [Agrocybe pediades]|nr:hypothetical protein CPC08DRAFT_771380 [Agrocybe pediades]